MSHADPAMKAYYAARAKEYERIYAKPERQADLRELERLIPASLKGRRILEIACGTGYWTQYIARTARSILATDLTQETLDVASSKDLPQDKVRFAIADAYNLPADQGAFEGAYAGFWWSHMTHAQCRPFLQSLHKCLAPGAKVVFMDNRYVERSSTPLSRTDAEGNTYQLRKLDNGNTHEVLKNFPTEAGLLRAIEGFGVNARYTPLEYYWLFEYDAR